MGRSTRTSPPTQEMESGYNYTHTIFSSRILIGHQITIQATQLLTSNESHGDDRPDQRKF